MTTEAGSLEVYLRGDIDFDPERPIGGGGYGDLFKGNHPTKGTLALKRLRTRIAQDSDPRAIRLAQNAYIAEVAIWRKLHHPNVLLCLGLLHDSWDEIYIVSPWMEYGSLVHFIACHPDADRTQLLSDAAEGLAYLHENEIVHGDVKGLNAVVTAERRVALCDFGLSKLASTVNSSTGALGTLYWQSPELLMGGARTKQADVYAFGIMIYEILSGQIPFKQHQSGALVVAVVVHDERPPKNPEASPQGESYAEHWRLAELCWAKEVDDRPTIMTVVAQWPSSGGEGDNHPAETGMAPHPPPAIQDDPADLSEDIRLNRDALALRPPGHPERSAYLQSLGCALYERYCVGKATSDLNEAIIHLREAISLRPPGDPQRAESLHDLGRFVRVRHVQQRNPSDLKEAVALFREAAQLRPPGHPDRADTLHHLTTFLDNNVQELNEAITLEREVVQLRPLGHPQRGVSLRNLGHFLRKRGWLVPNNASDLGEAITVLREAMQLHSPELPDHGSYLFHLGSALGDRAKRENNPVDSDEAITLQRAVVQLRPPGHPERAIALHNLADSLETRHRLRHNAADLGEAIQAWEEYLKLHPIPNSTGHQRAQQQLSRLRGVARQPSYLENLVSLIF